MGFHQLERLSGPIPYAPPAAHGMAPSTHFPAQRWNMFPTLYDDRPRLQLLATHTGELLDLVGPSVLAGRHSDADLKLSLCDVSRRHCRFEYDAGTWHVIDLSSRNGTYVNEERVENAVVHCGDRVRIGNFVFEIKAGQTEQLTYRKAS